MSDTFDEDTSDLDDDFGNQLQSLNDQVEGLQDRVIGLLDRVEDLAERFSMSSPSSSLNSTTANSLPGSSQAIVDDNHHLSRSFPATMRPLTTSRQEPPPLYLHPSATFNRQQIDDSETSDSHSLCTVDYDYIDSIASSQVPQDMGSGASRTTPHPASEPIDLTGGSPPRPNPLHVSLNMSSANTRPPKRRREEIGSDTTNSDGPAPRKRRRNATTTATIHRSRNAPVSASAPSERSTFHPPLAPERHHAPHRPAPTANRTIEQIDLCNDDDDDPEDKAKQQLQLTLQKQRADQIASQAQASTSTSSAHSSNNDTTNPSTAPGTRSGHTKLNSLTCTVCLETPTDLTATTCGHTFCRTCLMDWLVSSERDQSRRPNCPACRKALNWRPTAASRSANRDVVPVTFLKRKAVVG